MTPASAGSPLGARPEGAGSRSDNIAVREADAPETIALTQSQQAILNGLSEAQRRALCRCEMTSLGNGIPSNVEDARILHDAGLAWTPAHWWHPLNRDGETLRTTLLQANRNGK